MLVFDSSEITIEIRKIVGLVKMSFTAKELPESTFVVYLDKTTPPKVWGIVGQNALGENTAVDMGHSSVLGLVPNMKFARKKFCGRSP